MNFHCHNPLKKNSTGLQMTIFKTERWLSLNSAVNCSSPKLYWFFCPITLLFCLTVKQAAKKPLYATGPATNGRQVNKDLKYIIWK